MIKIKDYIFNENDITYIEQERNGLSIWRKSNRNELKLYDTTFDDIEWNYENSISESLSYDLSKARIQELEEENKTFEDYNKDLNNQLDKLEEEISKKHIREVQQKNIEYAGRIKKAIEQLKNANVDIDSVRLCEIIQYAEFILKGEENE